MVDAPLRDPMTGNIKASMRRKSYDEEQTALVYSYVKLE